MVVNGRGAGDCVVDAVAVVVLNTVAAIFCYWCLGGRCSDSGGVASYRFGI